MGQGTIAIGMKDGIIQVKKKYKKLKPEEIATLITNLELVKDELRNVYGELIQEQNQ